MEKNTVRRSKAILLLKKKPFYHLPPTAIPLALSDFRSAFRAWIDPESSHERFISALVNRTGNPNCFLVSSARCALLLILLSLKKRTNRTKVILPAYTCPTVAQSIFEAGLQPVFCDVSPETLDMDRDSLGKLLDNHTLAIIPTHLYGLVQDISNLADITQDMGICIIEDAAQAFGAEVHGNPVGNIGDFSFFSMGRGKCIPTGNGGIVFAKDSFAPDLEKTFHEIITDPVRRDILAIGGFLAYGLATTPLGWWFVVRSPLNPANAGMDRKSIPPIKRMHLSSTQAGIGTSILERIDQINAVRRRNARLLLDIISNYGFITVPKMPLGSKPVFLRLPIIIENKPLSDQLYQLFSKAGIGVSRSYVRTLPDIYSNHDAGIQKKFPGADHLADCLITLPTHHLVEDDIARIKAVFDSISPNIGG